MSLSFITIKPYLNMKTHLLMATAGLMTLSAMAQPQLSKDNIDEVLAAMTLQ